MPLHCGDVHIHIAAMLVVVMVVSCLHTMVMSISCLLRVRGHGDDAHVRDHVHLAAAFAMFVVDGARALHAMITDRCSCSLYHDDCDTSRLCYIHR